MLQQFTVNEEKKKGLERMKGNKSAVVFGCSATGRDPDIWVLGRTAARDCSGEIIELQV